MCSKLRIKKFCRTRNKQLSTKNVVPYKNEKSEVNQFCFRIYDKEGQGYITTETLRGLISELLAPLTPDELDGIIEELDEDGSGTMDFDEFCEMMMSTPEK